MLKSEWISVENELPEDGIVIFTNGEEIYFGVYDTEDNIPLWINGYPYTMNGKWFYSSSKVIEDVTHWMPLPEMP